MSFMESLHPGSLCPALKRASVMRRVSARFLKISRHYIDKSLFLLPRTDEGSCYMESFAAPLAGSPIQPQTYPSHPQWTEEWHYSEGEERQEEGAAWVKCCEALIKCNPIIWFPLEGNNNKGFPNNTSRPKQLLRSSPTLAHISSH